MVRVGGQEVKEIHVGEQEIIKVVEILKHLTIKVELMLNIIIRVVAVLKEVIIKVSALIIKAIILVIIIVNSEEKYQ